MLIVAWVCGIYAVMSMITFIAYGIDKRRATHNRQRIREHTLHLLEVLGGWPGAILGQIVFHHKRRKFSYMFVFAAIVILHLAIGYLLYSYMFQ
jgi:uncharacterized membrane protein YsdA (DUF1294 family)